VVAFDAVGPSSAGAGNAGTSPLQWNHTCGAGATALYVAIAVGQNSGNDNSFTVTATYNGVSMTALSAGQSANAAAMGGTNGFVKVFKMANPPTGSALQVSVTCSGALVSLSGGSISVTGSAGEGTLGVNFSSTNTTSGTVSVLNTVSGGLCLAFSANGSIGTDTWTSGTKRFENDQNSSSGAGNSSGATLASPGGTATMTWTQALDDYGVIAFEALPSGPQSSPAPQVPPGRFAPLSRLFPGTPFALPPSGPIVVQVTVTVQPVNAAITMAMPKLRRAPATRLTRGAQVPPVVVDSIQQALPRTRVQPKLRLTTGMLPGKGLSGIPPMSHIRPRQARLVVRPRGAINGPFSPGVVTVVTPIRPVVLVSPRRGPPRAPLRLVRGERGSLTVPVPRPVVLRCRQAPVPLRVFNLIRRGERGSLTVPIPVPIVLRNRNSVRPVPQRLIRGERGSLTVPIPVPIVLRNRQKIRSVQSRLMPGIVIPPFVYPAQPQPTIKVRTQYRLQRQPRMSIAVGMLPGRGLSGLPPTGHIRSRAARLVTRNSGTLRAGQRGSLTVPVPVPITLRDKRKIRPVQSKLTYPFFVSSVIVYPVVTAPTHIASTRYRLQIQPRMSLRTGMLPGKGLSGIPVQQTRSAPARIQRQPRMSLRTGYPGALTVPAVPVPIVLRNRNRVLRATSRLISGPFIPAGTFPAVIQQHYFLKPTWRLVRAPKMSVRTGMLPGTGLSGIPPFGHIRPKQAKAVPNVRSRLVPGPFIQVSLSARQSSKPVMKSRLQRRDKGSLRTGMLRGAGLSGIPPKGHLRTLPPRILQRRSSERIRTGWPGWGFVSSFPGQVAIVHSLTNTVTVVNASATVVITDQNVSSVQAGNTSATVTISNALASSATAKNSETAP